MRWKLLLAVSGGVVLWGCSPSEESAGSVEELQAELERTRKERDSLLEKLDASTRERVDLDGEINRLKAELEALKKKKAAP